MYKLSAVFLLLVSSVGFSQNITSETTDMPEVQTTSVHSATSSSGSEQNTVSCIQWVNSVSDATKKVLYYQAELPASEGNRIPYLTWIWDNGFSDNLKNHSQFDSERACKEFVKTMAVKWAGIVARYRLSTDTKDIFTSHDLMKKIQDSLANDIAQLRKTSTSPNLIPAQTLIHYQDLVLKTRTNLSPEVTSLLIRWNWAAQYLAKKKKVREFNDQVEVVIENYFYYWDGRVLGVCEKGCAEDIRNAVSEVAGKEKLIDLETLNLAVRNYNQKLEEAQNFANALPLSPAFLKIADDFARSK